MAKDREEWFRQADYDLNTAEFMFNGGRLFYAVFMCHLSIEKALKGIYQEKLKEIPPKVHNLLYLINKIGIMPPEPLAKFIIKLNEASVPTRYPENLATLQKNYTQDVVREIIFKSGELLNWIRSQL